MLAGVCADSETSKFCKTFCPSTIAHINHDFNESLGDVPPAAAAAAGKPAAATTSSGVNPGGLITDENLPFIQLALLALIGAIAYMYFS
mmetsp:Transcript_9045/g.15456  ORF Transcript_9045/g.15456 Transcript_9045/m.15456 type:complete len:89 (-) Transcript_9045:597-863(-)